MRKSWILGTAVLLGIWIGVTGTGLVGPLFLPPVHHVLRKLYFLIGSGSFWTDILATVWRTLAGFILGVVMGMCAGLLMGTHRIVYESMEFPIEFFRAIPASALFPLFIVIWGLGDQIQIFVAAWASSMVVLINALYGVKSVRLTRLRVARLKRMPSWAVYYRVIVPEALPYIAAGARIGLSLAMVVEIVSEMFLGARAGLGRRIFNASSIFEMDEAYAAILTVGMLGYLANQAILALERRVVHWAGK